MLQTKESRQNVALKSITDFYFSLTLGLIILCIIYIYRESYPINYLILSVWIFALGAGVPPACVLVLFYQDSFEIEIEASLCLETITNLSLQKLDELSKFQWPNSSTIRDHLSARANSIAIAWTITSILSFSIFFLEFQFELSNIYLMPYLKNVHSAVSCWWLYASFSGLRFGGYHVTESQHGLAAPFNKYDMPL
jgi:hypothetical protein